MPRIKAPSIEEHVAQQRAKILEHALGLFQDTGYAGVDVGMIAAAVGLKRSSFYRYYRNKEDVLIACVEQAMAPVIARNRAIAEGLRPPEDRVLAWVEAQFRFATGPDHATHALTKELQVFAPSARKQIMKLHIGIYKTLSAAVKDCLAGIDRDATTVASLISGMVQSAAALALENGGADAIEAELKEAAIAVLNAGAVTGAKDPHASKRSA